MVKNKKNRKTDPLESELISRKEAMKKAGKYTIFTAASMLFLFSSKDVQAFSEWPEDIPPWEW